MALVRIQGESEKQRGIYYEYNPSDTPLGEGGMGKVYKGWLCSETTNQRREVAIKFLYSDLPPHVIARARREAAVQLRNDNLIEMLGFVETCDRDEIGQPMVRYHVISEYLHGITLDKLLSGCVSDYKGNVIPFAQELYGKNLNDSYNFALTIVRNLLSGLMALHDAGYIHRDIDPSNIMITSNGKIKLIDFGIAKKVNSSNTKENSYTIDGQFIGKPKYAAPELVRGLVNSQNIVTDLYAVGILLYQLLTGKVPFEGEMAEVLDMQLNKKMPLHNIKQKQIKDVIKTATQKKRSLRYQSAAEFRVAVDRLIPLAYPAKKTNFKTIATALGGVAVVLLIIGAIGLLNRNSSSLDEAQAYIPPVTDNQSDEGKTEIEEPPSLSYNQAVALLSDTKTANEGLEMLQTLADKDSDATFLLSRLYLNLNIPDIVRVGAFYDSVALFQSNLSLQPNNKEAHRLLKRAVELNPTDYRALFELGCDYKSERRGAKVRLDSAYIYLNMAKELASQAGDKEYESAVAPRIENLPKPKDNFRNRKIN